MVLLLDEGLNHLAHLIDSQRGIQIAELQGAGAAGGLGAGAACQALRICLTGCPSIYGPILKTSK
ncbi:glycerate kinase [Paenibacillus kribbensis]|nr:glycerate kinase [Paenibacillus kribbensis]MEC0236865.1 glycerate kinase [Paenibacillus kribbensis]